MICQRCRRGNLYVAFSEANYTFCDIEVRKKEVILVLDRDASIAEKTIELTCSECQNIIEFKNKKDLHKFLKKQKKHNKIIKVKGLIRVSD